MERIISVLSFLWNWAVFSKAGRTWWHSIVPLYNIYVLFDIAGMANISFLFFFALFIWVFVLFVWWNSNEWTLFWFALFWICYIFIGVANYKVARRFWWWIFTSILYALFNPIAVFILGFWPYSYWHHIKTIDSNKESDLANKILKEEKSKIGINIIFIMILIALWCFMFLEIKNWIDSYNPDSAYTHYIIAGVLFFLFIFLWRQRRIMVDDPNNKQSLKQSGKKSWDNDWRELIE